MSERFGYLVPEYPGQTHVMFWRELVQLRTLGLDPRPVTTRAPVAALQAHAWAAQEAASTPRLHPVPTRELPRALGVVLRAGPRAWARVARAVLDSERAWRERPALLAAVLLGARLTDLARRDGWHHVHVHSCAGAADVARMARLLGGPTYSLTLHGPLGDYGPDQRAKWAGARFGLVITERLLGDLRAELGPALPERLVVSGMGVDVARFDRPTPYEPWTGQGPARVFSCGRLNPAKGHADLIAAIDLARAAGLPVELAIAGEDESGGSGYRTELTALVDRLGLGHCVRLLGAVPEETVLDELLRAHAFALASLEEPLGVAIMEAMAAGVPTVATAAGGVPELVRSGTDGLLVPPAAPRALVAALQRILTEPGCAVALSAAARASAEARAARPTSAQLLTELILYPEMGTNIGSRE
jgi:glycosyltransferase involved in cell wall biosynthesis